MSYKRNDFIEKLLTSEEKIEQHLARLLILLNIFSKNSKYEFKGLTKLVKLDFLLRYPTYLNKAINIDRKKKIDIKLIEYEKQNVESKMIKYLYGPWDPKYRNFLNILIAKNLLNIKYENKTLCIYMTDKGKEISNELLSLPEFNDQKFRSELLFKKFNAYSSTKMKNYIYETFPEIITLELGEKIEIRDEKSNEF